MLIAKMGSRYPEFYGSGYYNFIMVMTSEEMESKLEDNGHDFYLIDEVETRHQSIGAIIKKYPTKQLLNEGLFNAKV